MIVIIEKTRDAVLESISTSLVKNKFTNVVKTYRR